MTNEQLKELNKKARWNNTKLKFWGGVMNLSRKISEHACIKATTVVAEQIEVFGALMEGKDFETFAKEVKEQLEKSL